MSIKDGKRDYHVIWIEHGMRRFREYYRKNDAINFAIKIIHDGIYHKDVQVVDNRIGKTHLAKS